MVSEPDYDPNNPREAQRSRRGINRLTTGVYEMGSTFKALTLAMALDSGKRHADVELRRARSRCATASSPSTTYHAQHRVLTVPEIFTYSSNIGTARMALVARRRRPQGVPEEDGPARPPAHRIAGKRRAASCPKHWGELNTVTIAFGHGLSVAPLQAVMGVAATVNGGLLIPPTFLKRSPEEAAKVAKRVLKPETSREDALSDAAQRREGHRHARPMSRAIISAARPAPPRR